MFAAIESLLYIEQTKQKGNHGAFLAFFHLYSVSHWVSPEVCDLFHSDYVKGHRSCLDMVSPLSTTATPFPLHRCSFRMMSTKNSATIGQCSDATPPHDQLSGIQGLVRPSRTTEQWPEGGSTNTYTYNSQKCGIKDDFESLLCSPKWQSWLV